MLIDFGYLLRKYRIKPKGIIHLGANLGQEVETYKNHKISHILLVEAIPHIFRQLKDNTKHISQVLCINACISDTDNDYVNFHIASNEGQSSSMFEFGTHEQEHPSVKFIRDIKLKTVRMDTLLRKEFLTIDDYDFLCMDLQGAELMALKGFGELINKFKYVYTEINTAELYKGCPLVEEIDEYLGQFGFKGKEEKITGSKWGDKFYMK